MHEEFPRPIQAIPIKYNAQTHFKHHKNAKESVEKAASKTATIAELLLETDYHKHHKNAKESVEKAASKSATIAELLLETDYHKYRTPKTVHELKGTWK